MLWWTLRQLKAPVWQTRKRATKKLGSSKLTKILPPLLEMLKDNHDEVRNAAATTLFKLFEEPKDVENIRADYKQLLAEEEMLLKHYVKSASNRISRFKAAKFLVSIVDSEKLRSYVLDRNQELRIAAAIQLLYFGDLNVVDVVKSARKHYEKEIVKQAERALIWARLKNRTSNQLSNLDKSDLDKYVDFLKDFKNVSYRKISEALEYIKRFPKEPAISNAVNPLINFLKYCDEKRMKDRVDQVIICLGLIGDIRAIEPILYAKHSYSSCGIQLHKQEALENMKGPDALEKFFRFLIRNPGKPGRLADIDIQDRWYQPEKYKLTPEQFAQSIVKAFGKRVNGDLPDALIEMMEYFRSNKNFSMIRWTAIALTYAGDEGAIEPLIDCIIREDFIDNSEEPNENFYRNEMLGKVSEWIFKIADLDKAKPIVTKITPKLIDILKGDRCRFRYIVIALASIADSRAVELLIDVLENLQKNRENLTIGEEKKLKQTEDIVIKGLRRITKKELAKSCEWIAWWNMIKAEH